MAGCLLRIDDRRPQHLFDALRAGGWLRDYPRSAKTTTLAAGVWAGAAGACA